MNFTVLAFLDPFDLAASLRTRAGLFKRAEGGMLRLPLRGPRASAEDPDDEAGFVRYKPAASWPELGNMLTRIKRLGDQAGGVEFGRIHMEWLPAGYLGEWSLDTGEYAGRYMRTYLALRWNPGAVLFAGSEAHCLAPGWLTTVSARLPMSALNMGESNTVSLVIDSRKKADD